MNGAWLEVASQPSAPFAVVIFPVTGKDIAGATIYDGDGTVIRQPVG